MISHLRIATTNPHYHPPSGSVNIQNAGKSDRTSSLQSTLRGQFQRPKPQHASVTPLTCGNMPNHFDGRGFLEGTCMAKEEGILENKSEKRKHRKNSGKRKRLRRGLNFDQEDDDYYSASSSEDEEEERKVWKPVGMIDGATGKLENLQADIDSFKKEGLDWNRSTKWGKKSHKNFEEWLDAVGEKMHKSQVQKEDDLFTLI